MFSIKRMTYLMRSNLNTTELGKINILDFVDMYDEGAKFFNYYGPALAIGQTGKYDKFDTFRLVLYNISFYLI